VGQIERICNTCGQLKPASEYYALRSGRLCGECKQCKRNYSKKYRKENVGRVSGNNKKYYKNNKEKINLKVVLWKKANPQKDRESDERYRGKHINQIRISDKMYRERNKNSLKEKSLMYRMDNKEKRQETCAKYRANNKDKEFECSLRKRYKIGRSVFIQMLDAQGGRCMICGVKFDNKSKGKNVCVDHCHNTQRVRGLLCLKCNSGIGFFGDSQSKLRKAIEYLDRWAK
jgi:hypothetical protein